MKQLLTTIATVMLWGMGQHLQTYQLTMLSQTEKRELEMANGKQVCNTDNVYINQVYACFYWFLYPNFFMGDKSIEPKDGNVVIATINGEITVKLLSVVESMMT